MYTIREKIKLKPEIIEYLERKGVEKIVFKPGTYIFRQGYEVDNIFLITEGLAKLVLHDEHGNSKIIGLASEDDVIGFSGMFSGIKSPASTIAVTEITAYKINKMNAMKYIDENTELRNHLLMIMGVTVDFHISSLMIQSFYSVKERLAFVLLNLSMRFGNRTEDGNIEIKYEFTDVLLGGIVGSSRETIARNMSVLRDEDIILKKNKRIIIKDVSKLNDIIAQ